MRNKYKIKTFNGINYTFNKVEKATKEIGNNEVVCFKGEDIIDDNKSFLFNENIKDKFDPEKISIDLFNSLTKDYKFTIISEYYIFINLILREGSFGKIFFSD